MRRDFPDSRHRIAVLVDLKGDKLFYEDRNRHKFDRAMLSIILIEKEFYRDD